MRSRPVWPAGQQGQRAKRLAERLALAAVIAFAAALRLARIAPDESPTFHPSLGSVLFVDDLLRRSGVSGALRHWAGLFSSLQGLSLVDRSVVGFPPAVLGHLVLGPSLDLPAFVGTLHGVLGVALAWAVGRSWGGPALGLLFAAFLAVSPVEIVWSRIGGLYIACVPHLLLGVWLARLAGRRGSAALACGAGAVAWLSLYNYYAARLLLPVSIAVLMSSVARGTSGAARQIGLLAWFLAPIGVGHLVFSADGLAQTLWPAAGGGYIPPAERSASRMGALAWQRLGDHWLPTLRLVFTAGRTMPPRPYGWSVESGGMLPLPVLLLGAIGFVAALADARRHGAWPLLAVLGFLMTASSGAEVRRLLPVDVAWNYLAALAVAMMLRSRIGARLPARASALVLSACVLSLGVWSVSAITDLTRRETRALAPIPFGGGMLAEAIMCRSCAETAHHWRRRIRDGTLVVAFDHDYTRDAQLFRLRLSGYGTLAALDAGRRDYFVSAYEEWQGMPWRRPSAGLCTTDARRVEALVARTRPRPAAVSWYFVDPTARERTIIDALGTVGTTTRPFATARHVEVVTAGAGIDRALEVLARTMR